MRPPRRGDTPKCPPPSTATRHPGIPHKKAALPLTKVIRQSRSSFISFISFICFPSCQPGKPEYLPALRLHSVRVPCMLPQEIHR